MRFNDYLAISLYFFLSFFLIFLIDFFADNHFFDVPYANCLILTNYNSDGVNYGGLSNYLSALGMYCIKGIGLFAFVFPTLYMLDSNLLKNYLLESDKRNNKELLFSKWLLLIVLPIPPIIYDFAPFLIYDYTCIELIKIYNLY